MKKGTDAAVRGLKALFACHSHSNVAHTDLGTLIDSFSSLAYKFMLVLMPI